MKGLKNRHNYKCGSKLFTLFVICYLQVKALLSLVTELLEILRGIGEGEESIINKQTALYSLKLLTRLLAKEHPGEFKEVRRFILKRFSLFRYLTLNSPVVALLFAQVMTAAIDVFSSKDANTQVSVSCSTYKFSLAAPNDSSFGTN